jgi:hypothetical protein
MRREIMLRVPAVFDTWSLAIAFGNDVGRIVLRAPFPVLLEFTGNEKFKHAHFLLNAATSAAMNRASMDCGAMDGDGETDAGP